MKVNSMKQKAFFEFVGSLTEKELDFLFYKLGYEWEQFKRDKIKYCIQNDISKSVLKHNIGLLAYWFLIYEKHKNAWIVDAILDEILSERERKENENKWTRKRND